MLVVSREVEEGLLIGSDIVVRVLGIEVSPDGRHARVKLGIDAPPSIPIWREEIVPNGRDERRGPPSRTALPQARRG